MSEVMSRWFERLHPLNGAAAYGLRGPDGAFQAQSFDGGIKESDLLDLWPRLAAIAQASIPPGESCDSLCWTFERHIVSAAARPDGAVFFLLRSTDEPFDSAAFAQFSTDFLALQ